METWKKERKCSDNIVAFLSENSFENVVDHLRLFRVPELDCSPACASFEADFVDGIRQKSRNFKFGEFSTFSTKFGENLRKYNQNRCKIR